MIQNIFQPELLQLMIKNTSHIYQLTQMDAHLKQIMIIVVELNADVQIIKKNIPTIIDNVIMILLEI